MSWFKDFFTNLFGGFWGRIADLFMKFLVGPVVYYLFGPLYELSGMMVEKMLSRIQPVLGDVGLSVTGLAAWLVEVFRIQDCISILITFFVLLLTLRMLKTVF